jgi:hypothetical protein
MLAERSGRASFPDTGALYPSRARPPYRTETADDLDDRPACRANPTGLVPRSIHRLEGLAAIRICCASRGNCCRRVIPKDAAILVADRAGYPRSWRGAENNNLSVPVNGRPAPNGLEEPGGREDERAFEVSPADAETRYSAPQAAARPPLRGPRRTPSGAASTKRLRGMIRLPVIAAALILPGLVLAQPSDHAARCHIGPPVSIAAQGQMRVRQVAAGSYLTGTVVSGLRFKPGAPLHGTYRSRTGWSWCLPRGSVLECDIRRNRPPRAERRAPRGRRSPRRSTSRQLMRAHRRGGGAWWRHRSVR